MIPWSNLERTFPNLDLIGTLTGTGFVSGSERHDTGAREDHRRGEGTAGKGAEGTADAVAMVDLPARRDRDHRHPRCNHRHRPLLPPAADEVIDRA